MMDEKQYATYKSNSKNIIKRVLNKLKKHKNDSYFNIYFYKLIDYVLTKQALLECLQNKQPFCDNSKVKYYEYMYIYDILSVSFMFIISPDNIVTLSTLASNKDKETDILDFIKKFFYELVEYKKDFNIILNREDYGFEKLEWTYITNTQGYSIICTSNGKIRKKYCLDIDSSVINCIDNSNDEVEFKYNGDVDTIFDKIKNKKQYTKNDVKILNALLNVIFSLSKKDEYILKLVNYCISIINHNKQFIQDILMQRNIMQLIQVILNNKQYENENYIKNLLPYLLYVDFIKKIIMDLPSYCYKYINKDKVKELSNTLSMSRNKSFYFKEFIKITNILNS